MAKVLKMPNLQRGENPSGSTDLPELLELTTDEESEAVATINKWLALGDHAGQKVRKACTGHIHPPP